MTKPKNQQSPPVNYKKPEFVIAKYLISFIVRYSKANIVFQKLYLFPSSGEKMFLFFCLFTIYSH